MATANDTTTASGFSDEISDLDFENLSATARRSVPRFLPDIDLLIANPTKARKIEFGKVTGADGDPIKGNTALNDVYKAAKMRGVKVQALLRDKATPPVIIFRLRTDAAPETVAAPDSPATAE